MATISADIDLNVSKLLASLRQASDAAKTAGTAITSAFRDIQPTVDIKAEIDTTQAKNDAENLSKTLSGQLTNKPVTVAVTGDFAKVAEQAKAAGATIKNAIGDVNISTKIDTAGVSKVSKELNEATGEAKKLDNALETVDKELTGLGDKKINIGGQLSEGLKGGLLGGLLGGGIAGAVTTGLQGIGEAFKATIDLGAEFEQGLAGISAITGVQGAGLADLGQRARDLAKDFGGDAKTQLDSFQGILSRFGAQLADTPDQLGEVSRNINLLAKAGGLDAAGAMDALTGSMLQFGVNVNDANEVARESSRFINVLAASAKVGAAEIPEVAAAVKTAGAAMANANVSFEEGNAAIQVLATKSLKGSEAGTALTAVINKLQAASGPAADQLLSMGTSSAKLGELLTTKGIGAAMDELRTGMSTLGSDAEKNAFLVSLFGETGLTAASALLGGGDKLAEFTAGVTNTKEALIQAEKNMATFSEGMSRFKTGVSDIGLDLFASFKDAFTSGGSSFDMKEIMGGIQAGLKPVFASVAGNIAIVIEQAKAIVSVIILPFQVLYDVVIAVADAFGIAGDKSFDLTEIVKTVAASFKSFFTAIIDVTTAIRERVKSAIETAKPFLAALADGFRNIMTAAGIVADFLGNVFSGIGAIIGEAFGVVTSVINGLIETVQGAFVSTWETAVSAVKSVADFFKDNFNPAIETTSGVISSITNTVSGAFTSAWNGVQKAVAPVIKTFTDVRDKITEVGGVTNYLQGVLGGLEVAFGTILQVIRNFLTEVKSGNIISAIRGLFSDVSDLPENLGKAFDEGFNEATRRAKETSAAAKQATADISATGKTAESQAKKAAIGYKELAESVGALKVAAPTLDDDQLKAQAENLKSKVKNALNLGGITQAQDLELFKQIKEITNPKKEKKEGGKDAGDEALKKLREQIKNATELAKIAEDKKQQEAKALAVSEQRAITKDEENAAAEIGLKTLKEQYELLLKTTGAIKDDKGNVIEVKLAVKTENKQEALNEINKIGLAITDKEYALNIKTLVKAEDLSKTISDALASVKNVAAEIPVTLISNADDAAALRQDIQDQFSDIKATATAKLALTTDAAERAKITEQIKKINEEQGKALLLVDKQVAAARGAIREAEISGIADDVQRELETKIFALEKQRDKELENEALTGAARVVIAERYQKQIDALRNKNNAAGVIEAASLKFSEALQKSFTRTVTAEEKKRTAERIAELDKQSEALLQNLKSGAANYEETMNKLAELDKERAAATADNGGLVGAFDATTAALNATVAETLKTLADAQKAAAQAAFDAAKSGIDARIALERETAELEAEIDKARADGKVEREQELQARLLKIRANSEKSGNDLAADAAKLQQKITEARAGGRADEEKKLTAELADVQKEQAADTTNTSAKITEAYVNVASAAALSLGEAVASGKNFGDAIAGIAFDTLNSLVPIFVAQIFGTTFATLGPILGPIATAATTGLLYGLVALAKPKGAETGAPDGVGAGYNAPRGATDTIPLWVAPGEAIINAAQSEQWRDTLRAINSGGDVLQTVFNNTNPAEIAALLRENFTAPEIAAIVGTTDGVTAMPEFRLPNLTTPPLTIQAGGGTGAVELERQTEALTNVLEKNNSKQTQNLQRLAKVFVENGGVYVVPNNNDDAVKLEKARRSRIKRGGI